MWNAVLDEAQAGIKIAWRNINNLRYADGTTLMAENKEEQKDLLMNVKEESEKFGLKLKFQKTKLKASGPIISWQQLELNMEQQTGSKSGKEYVKAVYCHPVYLTYLQSTSWEMLCWMKHKLESRLPGEITSDRQMTPHLWQKAKN